MDYTLHRFILTLQLWIFMLMNLIVSSQSIWTDSGHNGNPNYGLSTVYKPSGDTNSYLTAYMDHLKAWTDAAKQTNSLPDIKETFKHHLPHISRLAQTEPTYKTYGNNQYMNKWFIDFMKQLERYNTQQYKNNAYEVNYGGLKNLYAKPGPPKPPHVVRLPPSPPIVPKYNKHHSSAIALPNLDQNLHWQDHSKANFGGGFNHELWSDNNHFVSNSPKIPTKMDSTEDLADLGSKYKFEEFDNHQFGSDLVAKPKIPTKNEGHVENFSFHSTKHVQGKNEVTEVVKYERGKTESHHWSSNNNNKNKANYYQSEPKENGRPERYSGTQTRSPAWFASGEVRDHRPPALDHLHQSTSLLSNKMDSMVETGCMDMMKRKKGIMGDRVTWKMLENVCHQCMVWNRACRTGANKPTGDVMKYWNSLMDEEPRHKKGKKRHKRQARRLPRRREYRTLSDEERHRFHEAVIRLKNTYVGDMSRYDVFVLFHQPDNSPEAHFGPAFFGWHREMLTRFENALQQIDDRVVLPYWDSRMDGYLGDRASRESITWTERFFGNLDGEVTSGPFAEFSLLNSVDGRDRLFRDRIGGRLMTDDDVANAVNSRSFRDLTFFVDPSFETAHGAVHNWIGGVFGDLMQSPSDPIFFLHHAFIDCVWEAHRRNGVNSTYPDDPEALGVGSISPRGFRPRTPRDSIHHSRAPLRPFDGLINIDGHSRYYTDREYSCATPPTCSNRRQCGSPYLFCDVDTGVCLPRLRIGARCDDFGGYNPCYEARCCNGRCATECNRNRRNRRRG